MSLLALLDLRGERALVVGGGRVAARRARTLLEAGLDVRVVAPRLDDELRALPVRQDARPYRDGDTQGAAVVVAATDVPAVNDAVAAEARRAGVLVNHAGEAGRGTLRFPAVTARAGVQVAVSTGRELPMLAQALGEAIGRLLPDEAQLEGWVRRREAALALGGAPRDAALAGLRLEIRRHLGLGA